MTERIRLCLAARWGGIRSLTALRVRHHDRQDRARCARPLASRETTARSEYKDLYPNGGWWHLPGNLAYPAFGSLAMCSQVTDTPAAASLRKMATRHDSE